MGIQRLNPDSVYTPAQESYSQVVTATGDRQVHVSGTVGLDVNGELVGESMRAQTEQTLQMLEQSLKAADADLSDIVRIRILTTDAEEYLHECHELTVQWYAEDQPVSTLHEVSGLAAAELKVEIEATAITDD